MKKVISSLIIIQVLLSSFCFAKLDVSKEETVYVNLDYEGNVEQINIYNKCITNGVEEIEDFTPFEEVSNLTNKEEAKKEEEKMIWNTKNLDSFSYTGKVSGDYFDKIPWKFQVSYQLNGVDKNPEELIHQKGLVKITMEIIANENASEYYQNNYMLEVTGNYDMSRYLSVSSEEAIVANAGNTKTLMFIVLPGQTTTLHIELGTEDFEMDGITMAIVKVSGNILDTVSRLAEEKKDIKDMLDSMDESTDIILNSLGNMNGGLNGISSGVKEIKEGTKEIHQLQNVRDEDIAIMKMELEEVIPLLEKVQNDVDNVTKDYEILVAGDAKIQEKLDSFSEEIGRLNKDFEKLLKCVRDLPEDVKELNRTLEDTSKLIGNLNTLISTSNEMSSFDGSSLKEDLMQIGQNTQMIAGVAQTVENPEVAGALMSSVQEISASLTSVQKTLEELEELSEGAASTSDSTAKNLKNLKRDFYDLSLVLEEDRAKVLVSSYEEFVDLVGTLEETVDILTTSNEALLANSGDYYLAADDAKESLEKIKQIDHTMMNMIGTLQKMLSSLSTKIYDGSDKVSDSILSVNRELTMITSQSNQFKETKSKIKEIVEKENDKLEEETTILNVDKDAKVESFGSEKNEVSSVQFLLKTKDIKEVKEKVKDMEREEKPLTLMERIKVVFQKIIDFLKGLFQ